MNFWQSSVRIRLALFYAILLSVLLIAVAAAAMLFMRQSIGQQTDRHLTEATQAFTGELAAELNEMPTPAAALAASLSEFHFTNIRIVVLSDQLSGRRDILGASMPVIGIQNLVLDSTRLRHVVNGSAGAASWSFTQSAGGAEQRVFARPHTLAGQRILIVTLQSRAAEQAELRAILLGFVVAVPILLIIAGLTGYWFARYSLAPIAAMTTRAGSLSASNLSGRLPVANPADELGGLAAVINDLLARVEDALTQQRRFMADASHELRTPVAIVRNEAEITLARQTRPEGTYRDTLNVIHGESVRLSRIVDDLFLLARADAQEQPLRFTELYLDELLLEIVRSCQSLADRNDTHLSCHSNGEAAIFGDEDLLRRLFSNLIENGIKYTPGGQVDVILSSAANGYSITVRDDGPGIPPAAQPHIFERFFRADPARQRPEGESGGAGLGLPIARWIAQAHGGRIELTRSDGVFTEFVVTLTQLPAGTA